MKPAAIAHKFWLLVLSLAFNLELNAGERPDFTPEEQDWLDQSPLLTFSEVNWKPLSDVDDPGQYRGVIADYLDLISKRSGIRFSFTPSHSWAQVLEQFAAGEIDIVPAMSESDMIGADVLLSSPYITFPLVIVSRNDTDLVALVSALNGKRVGVGKNYTSYFYLKNNYPDIILQQSLDVPAGLQLLEDGKVEAFVGHIAVVVHAINEYGFDLRISGFADYRFEHRIGVDPANPLALSVINKVIASITPEDHSSLINRWFNLEITRFDYRLLSYFIGALALILVFFYYRYRLISKMNATLVQVAHTDELTKLSNRKRINEYMQDIEYRAERYGQYPRTCLILIDLDNFKRVNDTYGHDACDQVLVHLAGLLTRLTRRTDLVARWGGEEFLIICDNAGLDEALLIAEKLRKTIAEDDFPIVTKITASFGVIENTANESPLHAFARLDKKLYEAKHSGKNCVHG